MKFLIQCATWWPIYTLKLTSIFFFPNRAAKKGNLSICRLIIENLGNKNPSNFLESGDTLFHWAAKKGHLSLCKVIIRNITDKNPKAKGGRTPLHVAANYGHLAVCQLILDSIGKSNF